MTPPPSKIVKKLVKKIGHTSMEFFLSPEFLENIQYPPPGFSTSGPQFTQLQQILIYSELKQTSVENIC